MWAGEILPCKNIGLLLSALRDLPAELNWQLRIVGGGRLKAYWQRKVLELGLTQNIVFVGRVDHRQMLAQYMWADIFLFPSLREATGTVIVEAMLCGVPVIALDIHGACLVLDESCGVLIPVINDQQMVSDFRAAIVRLSKEFPLRARMGTRAREKALDQYGWEKRGIAMEEIYRRVLSPAPERLPTQDSYL
jgi:glycosyltransferase involved in cell wall biosynthesis